MTAKKLKRGVKPMFDGKAMNHKVSVRVPKSTMSLLLSEAKARALSVAEWVRQKLNAPVQK